MAYIGAEPAPGQNREVDDISSSFNGSTTAFTLQVSGVNVSPESANNILVNLGGVLQNPGTDYTIAASTLTFTTAPASGLSFFGLILGAGINTATVADDTIGASKLIDTAVTAGSYTTADITVDAQGRITAAASGTISGAEIADQAVTNAKVNNSAAIAGTKISPDFGSQNIVTTGSISGAAGTFTGDLTIPDTIVHTGDTDTKIRFPSANKVSVETAGTEKLAILHDEIIINETGGDFNFRIESDTNTHAVFLDAGNSKVGINNSSPNEELSVAGNVEISSGASILKISTSNPSVRFTDTDASGGYGQVGVNNTSGSLVMRSDDGNALSGTFMGFEVDGSEKMRITSDGKLGIGITAPSTAMHIRNTDDPVTITLQNSDSNTPTNSGGEILFKGTKTNGDPILFGGVGGRRRNQASDVTGYLALYRQNGDGSNASQEALRIRHDGEAIFSNLGSSPSNSVGGISLRTVPSDLPTYIVTSSAQHAANAYTHYEFFNSNGSVGSILTNGNGTAFNTSSDYRLKENETAITDGITRLKQLKPYKFNWKSDTSTIVDGFFAHEVSSIVPDAVFGNKDEVATQANVNSGHAENIGDPIYQKIDHSRLVPLLTAALKEAITKIETLETKVAALEAA